MIILKKTYIGFCLLFLLAALVLNMPTFSSFAQSPAPVIADATPAILENSAGADAAATPTYYNKGEVDAFDGEPDGGTGNSAGEIVFMLIVVFVCLFFVIEAIVSYLRKKMKQDHFKGGRR